MHPQPRSFLTLPIVFCILTCLASVNAPCTFAQQASDAAPADEISCASNFGSPVELDKKYLHLIPASPDEILTMQKGKPDIAAGPFTSGMFPYDRVEIYLVPTKVGEDESVEATLSLFARAIRDQKDSWFKIAQDRGFTSVSDFFNLTIGDTGDNSGDVSDQNAATAVSFAVKNMNAPIFKVSWWKHESGVSTFAEVRKILLLDFRTSPPKIMAALQCVSAVGGGACGDFDNGAAPTTTLACNWDRSKADFLCTSTATGDYTVPLTRRFYLASGKNSPYAADKDNPPDLVSLGRWSTTDRSWTTKSPDIPGLGRVTSLAQYSPDQIRGTAFLFASRGRDSSEPRFFAVIVDPQGPALALEILPQPLVDEPPSVRDADVVSAAPDLQSFVVPAVVHPAEKFADGVQPAFQVKILETLPNVSVWQVTAKQQNSHEVVWLAAGRNPKTGKFIFSAVRIASEFGEYAGCGSGRTKPFAAVIQRKADSLDALLDVEPSHQYDVEGKLYDRGDQGESVTLCPIQVKLSWNFSLGFIREENDPKCPDTTQARKLAISDDGVIAATPEVASSN
ncbi:MAG: hypothetical protein WB780_07980 [Candidatus Acidiferrales bacterium]